MSSLETATNYQTVRWMRKPLWMPTAKSKVFRIPVRPKIPEDESKELMRLHNNYRTQIKSLRRYLTYKHCTRFLASEDPEEKRKAFEEDLKHCMELNNKWNDTQKILREKYIAEQLESELDFARKRIEMEMIRAEEKMSEIEGIVRKEKESSRNFITPENIDESIEHAVENPTDYNFALELDGGKFLGRNEVYKLNEQEKISAQQ
ncbi:unnamed protein product [Phaedon cochleariae]|uniref:Small ribosomal subunit protein mS26 n=1 Tax=Phaedon cochleariae TaxID=80249 RepID=A0A9N9X4R4_PHACE|nr:unnamed protein product [Phaedon cochleariae]